MYEILCIFYDNLNEDNVLVTGIISVMGVMGMFCLMDLMGMLYVMGVLCEMDLLSVIGVMGLMGVMCMRGAISEKAGGRCIKGVRV